MGAGYWQAPDPTLDRPAGAARRIGCRRGESHWQTANPIAGPCAKNGAWRNCLYLVAGAWRNYRGPCAYLAALSGWLHLARAEGATLDRADIWPPI